MKLFRQNISKQKVFILGLLMGFTGCKQQPQSFLQKEYIIHALDSIAHYSLYRQAHNFDAIKQELLLNISDTTSLTEVHDKLEQVLHGIDRHSYVIRKEKWVQMLEGTNPDVLENPYPFQGKMLNDKYAFVSLDGFSGGDSIAANNYCDSLQKLISGLYNQQPLGWIIDLRHNTGGWAPAMIAGLGPILGMGVKAYSISANNKDLEHYYAKNDTVYIPLSDSVWTLQEQLPTAVLIGPNTGSAGELLALAFQGNSKTRLVGNPTYGVSTDLTAVSMPDSFQLVIASAVMTNRNKTGNGGSISPEISCTETDVFNQAYKWIEMNQKAN